MAPREHAPDRRDGRLPRWLLNADLELIGGLLLLGLLVLAFFQISDLVGDEPMSLDARILLALRQEGDPAVGIGPPALTGMMRDVTALGSGTLVGLFAFGLIGWLLLTGRPGAALFVTIAVLGGWFLNDLLKDYFARERPTVVPHLMGASHASFPSGHTMISAVLYPTMAELFGRLVERRRARFYLMSVAIGTALLVGFTRLYLGVHYPSDVLAGLCMGFAWALACGVIARRLQRWHVFRTASKDTSDALDEPSSAGSPPPDGARRPSPDSEDDRAAAARA